MEIHIKKNSLKPINMMGIMGKRVLLMVFVIMAISQSVYPQSSLTKPLLWNVSNIERVKVNPDLKKTKNKILKISDAYCEIKPVVVTDKKRSFAEDLHYYCSIGGYWWQDTLNPECYVHKDSERNPMTGEYDASRLVELSRRCSYLSVAYYITGDDKYLDTYKTQLYSWFMDKDTYMYPNFEYTAVVPGKNGNKGRTSGMIQAYSFIDVIESILLVNSITKIDTSLIQGIQRWFVDFASWAKNGRFGRAMCRSDNNTAVAYDIIMIEMYLFVGQENRAKEIYEQFSEQRLLTQIDEDGKQKAELRRANAFSYSLYNLSHILDFCFIAKYWNHNYYMEHQRIIDSAYAYLQRFVHCQEDFPYRQDAGWEKCQRQLQSQLFRRERLRGNTMKVTESAGKPISLNVILN